MRFSFDHTEGFQGPDPENNPSDDLFLRDASDRRVSGIYGYAPVISHHKPTVFRYLVWQLYVAVSHGKL